MRNWNWRRVRTQFQLCTLRAYVKQICMARKTNGCDSYVVGICKQMNGSQNLKMGLKTELLILQLMKTTHFSDILTIVLSLSYIMHKHVHRSDP